MSTDTLDTLTSVRRRELHAWYLDLDATAEQKAAVLASEVELGAGWYRDARFRNWLDAADKYAAFCNEHGRRPKKGSDDWNEHNCFNFRNFQFSRRDVLDPFRLRYLNHVAPGWNETPRGPTFEEQTVRVKEFVAKANRFPTLANGVTEEERVIAVWLIGRRSDARRSAELTAMDPSWRSHGPFTPEREAHMDEQIPGWRGVTRPSRESVWQSRADETVAFVRANDRWPRTQRTARDEIPLRAWLSTQRSQALGGPGSSQFTEERREFLDANLPGWDAPYLRVGSIAYMNSHPEPRWY